MTMAAFQQATWGWTPSRIRAPILRVVVFARPATRRIRQLHAALLRRGDPA
ncbi:hypothetical protein [Dyella monticola]|uniref:hypothetical protein n=1 Tax=Dyella monticola TaxID=1927958 RepID=UPI00131435A1|nr:hypothetical protein [Dyella monticola]